MNPAIDIGQVEGGYMQGTLSISLSLHLTHCVLCDVACASARVWLSDIVVLSDRTAHRNGYVHVGGGDHRHSDEPRAADLERHLGVQGAQHQRYCFPNLIRYLKKSADVFLGGSVVRF